MAQRTKSPRKKSAPFPIEKLSPRHQAEARAQMAGVTREIFGSCKPPYLRPQGHPDYNAEKEATPAPTHKARKGERESLMAKLGQDVEREWFDKIKHAPKPKRKQAGRDETQVHRDVREMIKAAWPLCVLEEEYQFQLCEGHSYTVDFRVRAEGESIWIEAKGAHTWEDSRVKFLWCMTQLRWAFFIWAKQHKGGRWTFEVWHAGERLKLKGKYQNPKTMAECAYLIRDHKATVDALAERGE